MRTKTLTFLLAALPFGALSATTPIADYRFTDPDALGQVQGPEQIENAAGAKYALTRQGAPRYMNIPPDPADGRALRFNGKDSGYQFKGGIAEAKGPVLLEAWVRAEKANAAGLHGIVALGDGGRGYSLVQNGNQWGVFVGGSGFKSAGPVVPGVWTHLALTVGPGVNRTAYLNGAAAGGFPGTPPLEPLFTVGDMGHGKARFEGDIARVRLSRIAAGGFDPATDLLIDQAYVEEKKEESQAAAKARIQSILEGVTLQDSLDVPRYDGDWLVNPPDMASSVHPRMNDNSATLVLANGLVSRTFHIGQNAVCYSLRQEPNGDEFLRSIKPEATLTIGGKKVPVGGMTLPGRASGRKGAGSKGRTVANYFLTDWLNELVPDSNAFELVGMKTSAPKAWLKWEPMSEDTAAPWPPKGIRLSMLYKAPASQPALAGLKVVVHYEIYDGIPVIGKWLSFRNDGEAPVTLERTLIEELALADEQGNKIFIESEYNCFHATPTRWYIDPEFTTDSGPVYTERMSDYRLRYWSQNELDGAPWFRPESNGAEWQGEYRSRSLLQVQYPNGPDKTLEKGEAWSTSRVWLLVQDSMDEERKGLGRRKLYRTIFPWTRENLVYMHVLSHDSNAIRTAVDQAAACGFDMIVLTFGSGFNMMSTDPNYRARIKADFAYAHSKGIKTGAYILFCSSRGYNRADDAAPPAYGRSLCLGTEFADRYFKQLIDFMKEVGQDCIETDGPYHGYRCEKTSHALHKGRDDSWRVNWEQQDRFYRMCMDEGIYIITPDWYFASGGRKMPMGYKEANWTLPRPQQALVARQNIYDGTWWRTPSMSYHALPLTPVYGGGPESTMEPLSRHLDAYDRVLAQYFGMGIMACYRGYRLYDTDETKAVVKGWVDFYRKHQAILESDIIHVRRPDGRDLDCMMHANASLEEKGLAFIWNPTSERVTRSFTLPLYYTGLTDTATITEKDGPAKTYTLDREHNIEVPVDIDSNGYTWFIIK